MTLPSHDPDKRRRVLERRNLDLVEMVALFDGRPVFTYPSPKNGEERFVTVAEWHGKLCAVVWMYRDGARRIITARRGRITEEREFDRRGLQREPPDAKPSSRLNELEAIEREKDDEPGR